MGRSLVDDFPGSTMMHIAHRAVVDQHACFSKIVDMCGLDFEVEDGVAAGAGGNRGDGGFAFERFQSVVDMERFGTDEVLPVD